MKKRIVFVLVLKLGLASGSYSTEGIWTTKADMPTGRWELSTCVVDGKIYAIGGAGPVYQALRTVEEYDPDTDTWTTKSEMPTARQGLSTSVVNGKVYAIGGGAGSSSSYSSVKTFSTVEEYDPATDTWTTKSPMPTSRGFHSANVVDGKIYVIGGSRNSGPDRNCVPTVEVYDPTTDTWTPKSNMPRNIGAGFSSVVDGKIYVFGGYGGSSRVDEYDPLTDSWTTKSRMPTARHALSTSVVDGKIYVIGGYVPGVSGYPGLVTVEVYDPATDAWTTALDMPTGRFGPRTSVVDGKIFVIGGMGYWIRTAYGTVEEYDPNPLVVDFNGDGIVDIKDLLRLIESWGTDDPMVDIAPSSGDGVIDILDLELLMSYWKQPIDDPTLMAFWDLDETEGDIAYDSAGMNDAFVIGEPVWQPEGGMVNGAIELDGIDDYISTPFIMNSQTYDAFSVFVWIKGGRPGQVIISQEDDADWLLADSTSGTLASHLFSGRGAAALVSDVVITDGNWHRVGLTWDGSAKILYVDDEAVAMDSAIGTGNSQDGLYIGASRALRSGAFFSGLIDDVRIYNRAVTP